MTGTSKGRIYMVTDKAALMGFLVRAENRGQALRAIAAATYNVRVATQDDILEEARRGSPVLDASSGGNEEGGNDE